MNMLDEPNQLIGKNYIAWEFLKQLYDVIDASDITECTVCRMTGGPATCECHWCGGTALVSIGTVASQIAQGEGDLCEDFIAWSLL